MNTSLLEVSILKRIQEQCKSFFFNLFFSSKTIIFFYDINFISIGTSERPGLYKKGSAPGPGQYDVRGNIGVGQKSK